MRDELLFWVRLAEHDVDSSRTRLDTPASGTNVFTVVHDTVVAADSRSCSGA